MYYFTSDEHYGHKNIIKYCNRPFENTHFMDETLIENNNKIVTSKDVVIHVGDFTLRDKDFAESIIKRLKGSHIFIKGSHDKWMGQNFYPYLWEGMIEKQYIVACHYAMRVWPRSHYGSILAYGHSHGHLPPVGRQWDVGVDNNNYAPISFNQLVEIIKNVPIPERHV
jgi:calcineurin-like phosphoesterase family protein